MGSKFLALPLEIQLEILNLLSLYDLLNVRRTSRSFRQLTMDHEAYIVNHYIRTRIPHEMINLYPPPTKTPPTLRYLFDLAQKERTSNELARYLAEQVMKEMMGPTCPRRRNMSKEHSERLRKLQRGMAPLMLALFHFFETYTARKIEKLGGGGTCEGASASTRGESVSTGANRLSSEGNLKLQSEILSQHDDTLLLRVHQMYHLLLHLFFRRMTPPPLPILRTYLRSWSSARPPNESFAKILVVGGIGEVLRIYRMKGYTRRRRELEKSVKSMDDERWRRKRLLQRFCGNVGMGEEAVTEVEAGRDDRSCVSKLGLGFGAGMGDLGARYSCNWLLGSSLTFRASTDNPHIPRTMVDIDELTNLWTPAAEELLLSRGIIRTLNDVGCCGDFVSHLLADEDEDDDEDDDYADDSDEYQETGFTSLDGGTLMGDGEGYWDEDGEYHIGGDISDYTDYEESGWSGGVN